MRPIVNQKVAGPTLAGSDKTEEGVCKRYSAIWSNSRKHSKNIFAVNLGYRDNVHEF